MYFLRPTMQIWIYSHWFLWRILPILCVLSSDDSIKYSHYELLQTNNKNLICAQNKWLLWGNEVSIFKHFTQNWAGARYNFRIRPDLHLKGCTKEHQVATGKGWGVFIIRVRGRDSPTCHNVNREMILKTGKKKSITAALNLTCFLWLFSTVCFFVVKYLRVLPLLKESRQAVMLFQRKANCRWYESIEQTDPMLLKGHRSSQSPLMSLWCYVHQMSPCRWR